MFSTATGTWSTASSSVAPGTKTSHAPKAKAKDKRPSTSRRPNQRHSIRRAFTSVPVCCKWSWIRSNKSPGLVGSSRISSCPRAAIPMVPRSSETTRHRASLRSARPNAAACRVPPPCISSLFSESGKCTPKYAILLFCITSAPSCPAEPGSKRLSRSSSLISASKGTPPCKKCRSIGSRPGRTTKAPRSFRGQLVQPPGQRSQAGGVRARSLAA